MSLPDTSFLVVWSNAIAGIVSSIEKWLDSYVSHEALIAIPALFVALLVPIAFFLMEQQDLYGFDKNVILEKIILAKVSIPLVFLVSIALLFNIMALSVALTVLLLVMVIVVLLKVYKWMISIEVLKDKTTYKQDMRMKYIRGIKSDTKKIDTWTAILNSEKLSENNQRGLITEFLEAVKSLHDSSKRYPKTNLIRLMSRNIQKIDFSDIQSYEDLVAYSVEYFPEVRAVRDRRKKATGNGIKEMYPPYSQRELALNLLRIALDKKVNDTLGYIYFSTIKKYVAKDGVDEAGFIRDFIPAYLRIVKDNEDYEVGELWQELPDWVVTKDLLAKKETHNRASNLLNAYMESIGLEARLGVDLSNYEINVIDGATECVLPKIDAAFWFDIITFYHLGYGPNKEEGNIHEQIKYYVSAHRSFGLFSGMITSTWTSDEDTRMKFYEEAFRKRDEETIFILGQVFPWLYDQRETQKVLDQIKVIEDKRLFEADSIERRRLDSLKTQFEKIKSYTANTAIERNKKNSTSKKQLKHSYKGTSPQKPVRTGK